MKRTVAINCPAELSLERGQLKVQRRGENGLVPIEDIDLVVLDNQPIALTANLLASLCEAGSGLIVSGSNHLPVGILLPFEANVLTAQTLRIQIEASLPTKKRIWQEIIRAKIISQANHLNAKKLSCNRLFKFAEEVFSGDSTNRESAAAILYFRTLFGKEFVRQRQDEAGGSDSGFTLENASLNYGYAILRACMARAIVGAGLNPSLGIFHKHRNNAFALADDLMEPLRVIAERKTVSVCESFRGESELTPQIKREVLSILTTEVIWKETRCTLDVATEQYSASVRRCLAGKVKIPEIPIA